MSFTLADMIWPALYVAGGYWELFWYIIFPTILIEAAALHYIGKVKWVKSLLASLVGNFVSSIIGTYLMIYGMILYHIFIDSFLYKAFDIGSFDEIHWVATFYFMCVYSVLLEVVSVKYIFRMRFQDIIFPLFVGNALSYILTAILMANEVIKLGY
ncbi:MAG: hypothetical protein KDC42_01790 [Ignavibacteriae bacterium]|nr:hypothetical protein [Ignavibacteriota bacterium]